MYDAGVTVAKDPYYKDSFITLWQGDVLERLREMPSESVHCVVTSPPYLGLRNYGIEPSIWDAADDCKHRWSAPVLKNATNHTDKRRWQHTRNGRDEEQPTHKRVAWLRTPVDQGSTCQTCGAWFGCLGLEPTPQLFIKHITDVFLEIRRVMRSDGVLFLNIGDSYNGQGFRSANIQPNGDLSYGAGGNE